MIDEYVLPNNDKIAYRIIDGEAVIIDLKENTYNILNPVATFIWERLDGYTRLEDVAKSLSEEFDIDYKTAEKDCMDLISKMIDKEIVVSSPQ